MECAYLKPNEERRLLRGHAWAFRNEFERLPDAKDGDVVDVYTQRKRFRVLLQMPETRNRLSNLRHATHVLGW